MIFNKKRNKTINLILRIPEIKTKKGISNFDIKKIEKQLDINFPSDFKEVLNQLVPVNKGFYDWKDSSNYNMKYINDVIDSAKINLIESYSDIIWSDIFIEKGYNKNSEKFIEAVQKAPKLIPINGHRFISSLEGGPVFSISGGDIVYYGKNIEDYIKREFFNKSYPEIYFSKIKKVPFWSDLVEA